MASGSFEPNETSCLRSLLPDCDLFINVGANIGYYCCHAIACGCNVVAFEPVIRNLHYLMKNIVANNWSNKIEIFPLVLGASSEILPMWGGGTGASLVKGWASIAESDSALVPVSTLDRVTQDACTGQKTLILIDVEGGELGVLRGASALLSLRPTPIWVVEICFSEHRPGETNPDFLATFDVFFSAGYRAFSLEPNVSEIVRDGILEVISGSKVLTGHNFVFLGQDSEFLANKYFRHSAELGQ